MAHTVWGSSFLLAKPDANERTLVPPSPLISTDLFNGDDDYEENDDYEETSSFTT
jgi:hypothetical protein